MVKRRKNYWPSLLLGLIMWGCLGLLVYFVEPEMVKDILIPGLYLPFFLIFFPAVFLTLALFFGNSKKGLIYALGITTGLILQIYGLDNWLSLALLAAIIIAVDKAS